MILTSLDRLPESLCCIVMSCLVQIVSVRRSLFNNTERAKFLADIMKGIKGILENPQVNKCKSFYLLTFYLHDTTVNV